MAPGTGGVPVLHLVLAADAFENITVTSLFVLDLGSLIFSGVDAADLHADVNGNGLVDAGDTFLAAGTQSGKPVTISGAPVWGGTFTVTMTPPPPRSHGGSCGGGTSPSGPEGFLCWALWILALALVRAAAARRRVRVSPCSGR